MKTIGMFALSAALASVAAVAHYVAAAPVGDLKGLEIKYWQAWEKGPDAAEALYAKDADLVFYDLEPLKYVGWTAYKAGVGPNILSKFDSVSFKVNDDVKATLDGNIGWTSATIDADGALKGGSRVHVVIRHTAIWQKRGGRWLLVHEHASIPSSLPSPPAR